MISAIVKLEAGSWKGVAPARPSSKAKRGGRWQCEALTDEGYWNKL